MPDSPSTADTPATVAIPVTESLRTALRVRKAEAGLSYDQYLRQALDVDGTE